MGRKGKTQKHTAKEIANKHKAAREASGAAGGGGAAAALRKNAAHKVAVKCEICLAMQPNLPSMKNHYESKHAKVQYEGQGGHEEKYKAMFAANKAAVNLSDPKRKNDKKKDKKDPCKNANSAKKGDGKKKKKKGKNDISELEAALAAM